MDIRIQQYFDYIHQPWGELYYDVLIRQLDFAKGMKILDFGSGFGKLASMLAVNNDVLAIEPHHEMVENRFQENHYKQVCGDFDSLCLLPDATFDIVICHNVLEYVPNRKQIVSEFYRVLTDDGTLSIVKHNRYGAIMQKIVFENKVDEALCLLKGNDSKSESFGEILYYNNQDIIGWNQKFHLSEIQGIRHFWALQQSNEIKYSKSWKEKMLHAELEVSMIKEFTDVAFYNHLLFRKNIK